MSTAVTVLGWGAACGRRRGGHRRAAAVGLTVTLGQTTLIYPIRLPEKERLTGVFEALKDIEMRLVHTEGELQGFLRED